MLDGVVLPGHVARGRPSVLVGAFPELPRGLPRPVEIGDCDILEETTSLPVDSRGEDDQEMGEAESRASTADSASVKSN